MIYRNKDIITCDEDYLLWAEMGGIPSYMVFTKTKKLKYIEVYKLFDIYKPHLIHFKKFGTIRNEDEYKEFFISEMRLFSLGEIKGVSLTEFYASGNKNMIYRLYK